MTYAAEVLADSPIAYWRLGDASGSTMVDSSGNGRNGTYNNSPTLGVAGLLSSDADTAVNFASASSQSATFADDNSLDGLSAFTVEAWIKPTTVSASQNMIVSRDGGTNRSFQFRLNNGKLEFLKISGGTGISSSTLSAGSTYHVAAVYNGTDIRMYVNGALNGSPVAATGTLGTVTRDLEIAARIGALYFNGVIDEVAVYGTALSSTRISDHYAAGTAVSQTVNAPAASASAVGLVPTVTVPGGSTVSAPAATATAAAVVPSVVAGSGVSAPAAAASAVGLVPSTATGGSVVAPAATAAAAGVVPFVSNGSPDQTVNAPAATAAAGALAPSVLSVIPTETDTSNALAGLDLVCVGSTSVSTPAAVVPPTLVVAERYEVALPYPVPVMVDGRPT